MRRCPKKVNSNPIIIEVANPGTHFKRSTIIVLELADEDDAVRIAYKLAKTTGRAVVVRDDGGVEIEAIPAATPQ
jgi:hypothetical protein